jgi:signal transduction histidine kinase/ActR/RegA family two-component response regulator
MSRSARRPGRLFGLRWHLVGLVAVSLLPGILFAAALVGRSARETRAAVEAELLQRARVHAAGIDREITASVRALDTLAHSETLARGDLEAFRREALRVVEARPDWLAILVFTTAGERVVDTRELAPGGKTLDPVALAAVVQDARPSVGNVVRTRDGKSWAFPIRAPVTVRGTVHWVLAAAVSADEIGRALAMGGPGGVEWTRAVIDRAGTIVARTRSQGDFVGRPATERFVAQTRAASEGLYRDTTAEGIEAVVGYAQAPLSGWTASVVAPAKLIDAPALGVQRGLAGAGLALLALSAAAAFILARRLSDSIGAAARATEALARGSRGAVPPNGIEELARLGEALRRSARLLEDRRRDLERTAARAAAARAQAEAASRAKDEFLAMLGHELRNPLSPIVTALRLLRGRDVWGRELEIVSRQVAHLVRLVDDLLDVSRLTRGTVRLAPERVELAAAVRQAVEQVSPLLDARRHHVDVSVPAGLAVRADPDRLAQVLANLLGNAARYTPPGGHVWVSAAREPRGVALEVRDDGQGIAPELLPRIFELFEQGPRTPERAGGGLGVGLAVVRSLVALHGGTIEARSAGTGQGSTFRVVLPSWSGEEGRTLSTPPPLPHARQRLRVLVVDDNEDAATLLAEFLSLAGHDVSVAHDGPGALAAAEASVPEVAVLDIGLPVMDGYELAARLRAKLGERTPVILGVSGYGQDGDQTRSREAGFRRHFVKPADPRELLAALDEVAGAEGSTAALSAVH